MDKIFELAMTSGNPVVFDFLERIKKVLDDKTISAATRYELVNELRKEYEAQENKSE